MPGYPIRTPWDHSSVDSSPRPIAASHVLHRLLMPRHPPYALSNLTTHNHPTRQTARRRNHSIKQLDARIHCAILNQHQTHTDLSAKTNATRRGIPTGADPSKPTKALVASGPNRMLAHAPTNRTARAFH